MKQNNDDDPDAANHHPTSVVMIIITKTRTKTNPSHAPPLWRKGWKQIVLWVGLSASAASGRGLVGHAMALFAPGLQQTHYSEAPVIIEGQGLSWRGYAWRLASDAHGEV